MAEQAIRRNSLVQYAKIFFLLIIVWGHVYKGPWSFLAGNFWILVDTGLFFLTATSGYFTARKYRPGCSWKPYWMNKVQRVFIGYTIINVFLLLLFLIRGKENVFSWHSVVSWVGMTGFLNWFRIQNQSPFGMGLWFLTVLFLFYLLFPLLNRFLTSPRVLDALLAAGFVCTAVLPSYYDYGVALWSTAYGFVVGIYIARRGLTLGVRHGLGILLLAVAAGAAVRASGVRELGYAIVSLIGTGCTVVLLTTSLRVSVPLLDRMGDILLPVYVIHQYFIYDYWRNPVVNGVASVLTSLVLGILLARVIHMALARLFPDRRAAMPEGALGSRPVAK